MNGTLAQVGKGCLAGGAATLCMSLVMLAGKRLGRYGQHPPERIVEAGLELTGQEPPPALLKRAIAVPLHFAFGAAAGGTFARLLPGLKLKAPLPVQGAGFGLLVWATSYKGWIPRLGIMPPPKADRPMRVWTMIVAHLVYGAVLGGLLEREGGSA